MRIHSYRKLLALAVATGAIIALVLFAVSPAPARLEPRERGLAEPPARSDELSLDQAGVARSSIGEADVPAAMPSELNSSTGPEGKIEFTSFSSSEPVAGAVWRLSTGDKRIELTSNDNGEVRVASGRWTIEAERADDVVRPREVFVSPGTPAQATVFPRQSLEIQVVDAATGAAIPGAVVVVEPPVELDDHLAVSDYAYERSATDQNGSARLSNLPGLSESVLGISAAGYEPLHVPVPDEAVVLGSQPTSTRPQIPLELAKGEHFIGLRFLTIGGEPMPGVLVRAEMYFADRPWAGHSMAFMGCSDEAGKLEVYGDYVRAMRFDCTGKCWPMTISGLQPNGEPPGTEVEVRSPACMPGYLKLPDEVTGMDSLEVLVTETTLSDQQSLRPMLSARQFNPRIEPGNLAAMELPSGSLMNVVATLPDGRRVIQVGPLVTGPGWIMNLNLAHQETAPSVEIRCASERIAGAVVLSRGPGGRARVAGPLGGTNSLKVGLIQGARAVEVYSVSGQGVMLSLNSQVETVRDGTVLDIDFAGGTEQRFEVEFEDGEPVRHHGVSLRPVVAGSDFLSERFAKQNLQGGVWGLRRGNLLSATTDADGLLSVVLPEGTYSYWVSAPSRTNALDDSLGASIQDEGLVYVGSVAARQTLTVRANRSLILDLSALRERRELPSRWFLRPRNEPGRQISCEGVRAETSIEITPTALEIVSEGGEVIHGFQVPGGTEEFTYVAR